MLLTRCVEVLKTHREGGVNRGLVVMATGLGKTILSALDVKNCNSKKILLLPIERNFKTIEIKFSDFFLKKNLDFINQKKRYEC